MDYSVKDIPSLIPKLQIVATQVIDQEYTYQVVLDTIEFLKKIYIETQGNLLEMTARKHIDDSNPDYIGPYARLSSTSLPIF